MAAFSNQAITSQCVWRSGIQWIGWNRSPQGWMKLNVDGSLGHETHMTGAGGSLKDDAGMQLDGQIYSATGEMHNRNSRNLGLTPWLKAGLEEWNREKDR